MTSKTPKPSKEKIPRNVTDLLVFPLHLPALPSLPSFPSPTKHYLYIRPDAPKQPTADTPRSLFLNNVPIDSNESSIRQLFKALCGAIVDRVDFESGIKDEDVLDALGLNTGTATVRGTEVQTEGSGILGKRKRKEEKELEEVAMDMRMPRVWKNDLRRSGSSAVIVFVDAASMQRAWKACRAAVKDGERVEWVDGRDLGETRYRMHQELRYPSRRTLQEKVNSYLTAFSTLEEARSKQLARQRSVPDEEGFITVTRGGRAGPARLENAQAAQEKLKARDKKRTAGDFYRFQTREERKKREHELKRKFEEDRRRVQKMRQRKGKIRPES